MSISGPPELPWLIGASVWIESEIENPPGESIERSSALTMPLVTVPGRPNGLPIAMTASPTSTLSESPSAIGWRIEDGASTLITARSVELSLSTSVAS